MVYRWLRRQDEFDLMVDDRPDEVGPVVEVVVELRLAAARGRQNIIETGRRHATLTHHGRGRVDDSGTAAQPSRGQ